jgi:hypothetical protein
MDPYLEHPGLWPDVHNRLIAAIADTLAPALAPRYHVRVEERMYMLKPDEPAFVGRADVAVAARPGAPLAGAPVAEAGVLEVDVPLEDEVGDWFLEIRDVVSGKLVTVVELLSPVNKLGAGRRKYLRKRSHVLGTRTNLVEVDLLRAGRPMPVSKAVQSDYRILVSRGRTRPRAQLILFGVRQPIPSFLLPLLPGDDEPSLDLNVVLHALYERARYDLVLNYARPATPPLNEADVAWARDLAQKAMPAR